MTDKLVPANYAEAVALFRSQVIGPLVCADLKRGQLRKALNELSEKIYRPPGSAINRQYHWQTLEFWYYKYKNGGLDALKPMPRSDRGHGRALSRQQRELLLAIRQEHPDASVPLIMRTLIEDGRLDEGLVAESTIRRLYRDYGLDRKTLAIAADGKVRLRWQADKPGDLWHADVCHGPSLDRNGGKLPLRIHAMLDDASRYSPAIECFHTEREIDMLKLCVKAVRVDGAADALYLENCATYTGQTLSVFCGRLGIKLLHAKPYDPQARGKMERFWRTLRQGCLNHMGSVSSLHDVQVRLLSFLDKHYHLAPHASLMGQCPARVYDEGMQKREVDRLSEQMLRDALTVRAKRRIRSDNTVHIAGAEWQLEHGFVARHVVTVGRCLLEPTEPPWVEHEGKRLPLHHVDPRSNAKRVRSKRPRRGIDAVDFDPTTTLLRKTVGLNTKKREDR
jgi:transposase InsO family protein